MAPPPPASLPLQERLLALVKTLQFAWFAGHLTLIICIGRYSMSWIRMNYYSRPAQISYRITFLAAAVTYGIVVYKTLRARQKSGAKIQAAGLVGLLADENVQYLLMAIVWLFSPQYPLAMLPYGIYSVFHFATYTRSNLIPTLVPPKPVAPASGASPSAKPQYATHPVADAIGSFVKEYYDASMSVVSGLEILLWVRLLLAAIFFQRRSWILLGIYTIFLRARFAQSSHVQNSFSQLEARVDALVGAQGTPPAARQVWEGVKGGARQFHSATDVNKYTSGAAVPKKTS
ncbi:Endoplasmic reticulum protein [Pleurostoma richardsiae]|uniref:Endoplasmic reticulum protein n=1 Tax=Pleurostoma richardsiae TaxID=41990 RepID=A0AA38SAM7_9PEZI|nr:Endoplasmic reticulum protein [Pleurostoma richardsiae]